jgi:hypothetical protein
MVRRLIIAVLVAVIGLGPGTVVVHFGSSEVVAQTKRVKQKERGFFQRLFGPRTDDRSLFGGVKTRKSKKQRASEPPLVTVEALPKDPNARKVLVVGDFIAGGLAWGLEQAFADEPRLIVIDKSDPNTGLIRADSYDWNANLPAILNETQPDLIAVVLGANDRQQLRDGKTRSAIRSPTWEAAYTTRIDGIVDTLKLYGRPFFWVGAPPMRATSASSDMAYFNGLFKPRVQEARGHFVDIWNGFANEDGNYITSGPDVEGQVRQLRTGDGINFTRAGRMKLAFYVEREIRRQTGFGSGGIDLLATVTQGNQIEIAPDGSKLLVGPIISLNDPLPGSSGDLAGGEPPSAPTAESLQFKVIVRGEALPQVPGRADDFSWPPKHIEALLPTVVPDPVASVIPVPEARPEGVAN